MATTECLSSDCPPLVEAALGLIHKRFLSRRAEIQVSLYERIGSQLVARYFYNKGGGSCNSVAWDITPSWDSALVVNRFRFGTPGEVDITDNCEDKKSGFKFIEGKKFSVRSSLFFRYAREGEGKDWVLEIDADKPRFFNRKEAPFQKVYFNEMLNWLEFVISQST